MTLTAYWRAIVRVVRTGGDIYIASIIHTVVSSFVQIDYWYIAPIAGIIAGIFKGLRDKYPQSKLWKYLPL